MTPPFLAGKCYFTPESIVEIASDNGGDEVMIEYNVLHGVTNIPSRSAYAWVKRFELAALIFGGWAR